MEGCQGNTREKSKILLLCLGLDVQNKVYKKIKIKDLLDIFQVFGVVRKIIIFSKKKFLKAFLEFSTFMEAQQAVKLASDSFINNIGKARLYFSDQ